MPQDDYEQIQKLFHELLAIPESDRLSYLERVGVEAALRDQVLEMLALDTASDDSESTLDRLAGALFGEYGAAPSRPMMDNVAEYPEQIGPYTIHGVIGRGGMGIVYEATQPNPRRSVALKVMKAGFASPELKRRFDLETKALARLQHPGIAAIHEAGVWDTGTELRPYFAMERVRGEDLQRYLKSHQLSVEDRIGLFLKIADAVAHAHGRGVIHRDLKPANVLVSTEGEPKVLDFGIARTSDPEEGDRPTQTGQIIGTLEYMSPEQFSGNEAVDVRSDVYSLGVVLFQMLTGEKPVVAQGSTVAANLQSLISQQPKRLSQIERRFRGDLDAILAKALESSPRHRYSTVAEFAADLRRFLNLEPVGARPLTTFYQLRRFARRNRGLVSSLAAIFFATLLGFVVTLRSLRIESRARHDAEQATRLAEQAKLEAIAAREEVEREARISRSKTEMFQDLLNSADPSIALGRELTVKELLDHMSTKLDHEEDLELAAALRYTLGRAFYSLGKKSESVAEFEKSVDLYREIGRESIDYYKAVGSFAVALRAVGERERAAELYPIAISGYIAQLGPDHSETLDYKMNYATFLYHLGELEKAESLLHEVVVGQTKRLGADAQKTLRALHNHAAILLRLGRVDIAETRLRELVTRRRKALGEHHPETLSTLGMLAGALQYQQRYSDALAIFEEIYRGQVEVLGATHPLTLLTRHNRASMLARLDRYSEAIPIARETVEIATRELGADDPQTHQFRLGLAESFVAQEDFDSALPLLETVLDFRLRKLGPDHPKTASARHSLAIALAGAGRHEEARVLAELSFRGSSARLGPDHPDTLIAAASLARLTYQTGEVEEAAAKFEGLLTRATDSLDEDRWQRYYLVGKAGEYFLLVKRYEEAEARLLEAFEGLDRLVGRSSQDTREVLEQLEALFTELGQSDRAAKYREMRLEAKSPPAAD